MREKCRHRCASFFGFDDADAVAHELVDAPISLLAELLQADFNLKLSDLTADEIARPQLNCGAHVVRPSIRLDLGAANPPPHVQRLDALGFDLHPNAAAIDHEFFADLFTIKLG